jgi:hypothetical protein
MQSSLLLPQMIWRWRETRPKLSIDFISLPVVSFRFSTLDLSPYLIRPANSYGTLLGSVLRYNVLFLAMEAILTGGSFTQLNTWRET